jgi:ribosomal protein S18 acetylase RimI-like enzyme
VWGTRRATAADHPAIVRLFAELGVPDPPPEAADFEQHMLPRVLVACESGYRGDGGGGDGDVVVGYACWRIYDDVAHVVNVVTAPSTRGCGVGRALMDATRRAVIEEGGQRWYLNVKRDNEPARRLYERCGMAIERDLWLLAARWKQIDALAAEPSAAAASAYTPGPDDEAAIADHFGLPRARLASLGARAGVVPVALRDGGRPVAYAAFDQRLPGALVLCADRTGLVRPLLEVWRPHAAPSGADLVRLVVDGEPSLMQALVDVGAEVTFELVQMGGALVA